jgi:hypothetical protein
MMYRNFPVHYFNHWYYILDNKRKNECILIVPVMSTVNIKANDIRMIIKNALGTHI